MILTLIFCLSCNNTAAGVVDVEILFPPDAFTMEEGTALTLLADCNSGEPCWYLSDELIGSGYSLTITPFCGEFKLRCESPANTEVEQTLQVLEPGFIAGADRFLLGTQIENPILLAAGSYIPFAINYNGQYSQTVSMSISETSRSCNTVHKETEDTLFRDTHIVMDLNAGSLQCYHPVVSRSTEVRNSYSIGDMRTFRFPDPFDICNVTDVEARLMYLIDGFQIWVDNNDIENTGVADTALLLDGLHVCSRTKLFWGDPADIDADGSVIIFLTSRINQTQAILGFFNPLDSFIWNDDENSEDYNPSSNETDIVYAAIPENNESSYNVSAVTATIAHELHHLIHFQRKTLIRMWSGHSDAPVEELFLDEGLSHLQESLCGLGESGGNLMFVRRWLLDTPSVSFSGSDLDGSTDSAGKRGAMAALLWFLFEKQGGAEWSDDIPVDRGGISFLNNLVDNYETGWDSLERSTGMSREMILREYAGWINRMRFDNAANQGIVYDASTGEIISILPYLDHFDFQQHLYTLNGPVEYTESVKCAPESFVFMTSFGLDSKSKIVLKQSKAGLQTLWCFGM